MFRFCEQLFRDFAHSRISGGNLDFLWSSVEGWAGRPTVIEENDTYPRSAAVARLGAASYVVWALLHFQAAWSVYQLGRGIEPSMVQGRVFQDAWNLACFSVAGLGVALALNWRNDLWGYWINLAVISAADVGFILFVLLPGHIGLWPGMLGPVFWILGLALTTAARAAPLTVRTS